MSKKYDLAIYIGRFQPFHLGHLHMLEQCAKLATTTLVLLGYSHENARTIRNPFVYDERREMVERAAASIRAHVITAPLKNVDDDELWKLHVANAVDVTVASLKHRHPGISLDKIVLVGHHRDQTSEYLSYFPQWPLESLEDFEGINATAIRKNLLETPSAWPVWRTQAIAKLLPESTLGYLGEVIHEDTHRIDDIFKDLRVTSSEELTLDHAQS